MRDREDELIVEFVMVNFLYEMEMYSNDAMQIRMFANNFFMFYDEQPLNDGPVFSNAVAVTKKVLLGHHNTMNEVVIDEKFYEILMNQETTDGHDLFTFVMETTKEGDSKIVVSLSELKFNVNT